jgi:hypothetical protein
MQDEEMLDLLQGQPCTMCGAELIDPNNNGVAVVTDLSHAVMHNIDLHNRMCISTL